MPENDEIRAPIPSEPVFNENDTAFVAGEPCTIRRRDPRYDLMEGGLGI
jgi:hypothetical protein